MQSRHLTGIRKSFLQIQMLNCGLRSGHLLNVSIPGKYAVSGQRQEEAWCVQEFMRLER